MQYFRINTLVVCLTVLGLAQPGFGAAVRDSPCTKKLPASLKAALRDELCGGGAPGYPTGPAVCAAATKKSFPSWPAEALGQLCKGASGDGPAMCAAAFKVGTSRDLVIELCAPANGRATYDGAMPTESAAVKAPARCAEAAPRSWPVSDVASLCDGAEPSLDGASQAPPPATCALAAGRASVLRSAKSVSPAVVAALCRHAPPAAPEGPVECALAAPSLLKTPITAAKKSTAPGKKTLFSRSSSSSSSSGGINAGGAGILLRDVAAEEHHLVGLCARATSASPAQCFAASEPRNKLQGVKLSESDRVQLCAGAVDTARATCASSVALSGLSPSLRVQLCLGESTSNDVDGSSSSSAGGEGKGAPKAAVSGSTSSISASTKSTGGPAACVAAASRPLDGNEDLLVALCVGATGSGPAKCLAKAPLTLPLSQRVVLCARAAEDGSGGGGVVAAVSTGPGDCVRALQTLRISQSEADASAAVALCRGAESPAPATCFETAPADYSTEQRIHLCQGAPMPSSSTASVGAEAGTGIGMTPMMSTRGPMPAPAECAVRAHQLRVPPPVAIALCQGLAVLAPPPYEPPLELPSSAKVSKGTASKPSSSTGSTSSSNSKNRAQPNAYAAKKAAEAAAREEAKAARRLAEDSSSSSGKSRQQQRSFGGAPDCAAQALAALSGSARLSNAALVQLCGSGSSGEISGSGSGTGGGSGGGDVRAAQCFVASGTALRHHHGLSPDHRAALCARARSDVPARCAALAPTSGLASALSSLATARAGGSSAGHGPSGSLADAHGLALVHLCGGASSVTPGACAYDRVQRQMKPFDHDSLQHCQRAIAQPHSVQVQRMWWEGGEPTSSDDGLASSSGASNTGGGKGRSGQQQQQQGQPKKHAREASSDSEAVVDARGPGLFAGRVIHVVLQVLDQYQFPLDLATCAGCPDPEGLALVTASASVPKGSGSSGVSPTTSGGSGSTTRATTSSGLGLEGIRVNATDSHGQVHFNALRFSDAGLYDLKFTLGRGPKAPLDNPGSGTTFGSSSSKGGNSRSGSSSYDGGVSDAVNPTGVAVVRVAVAPHDDDSLGPLGRCGQALYALMQSVPQPLFLGGNAQDGQSTTTTASKSHADGFGGGTGSVLSTEEMLAWLPAPHALWAPLPNLEAQQGSDGINNSNSGGGIDNTGRSSISSSSSSSTGGIDNETGSGDGDSSSINSCGALLSAAGFRATAGWNGGVWLLYRPAAVALDTGIGLPTPQMSPLERLGLAPVVNPSSSSSSSSRSAQQPSERAVRRAYYQASLLWHPDRWASYPGAFQRRAMDCFELISDAYRVLSEPLNDEGQTSNDGSKGSSRSGSHADASAPIVLGM